MQIRELLRLYHTHHLSQKPSATYYGRLIRQVMGPLNGHEAESLQKIVLLEWFTPLKTTPGHARKALGCIRAAYRWGMRNDLIKCLDPTIGIQNCPVQRRCVTISPREWALIIPSLERRPIKPRAYFWTQYLLGKRSGETARIRTDELHLDQPIPAIVNPRAKNGRPHLTPIPMELIPMLRVLVRCNPPNALYIFCGDRPDAHWHRTSYQKMWESIRTEAGLRHIRLTDLRRSTASDLLNQGENLGVVQGQLGHASLSQTATYAYLAIKPLADALQKRTDMIVKECGLVG